MKVTTIGIDLAKNVFAIHGVDMHGNTILRKQLKRHRMLPFFAQMPPCLIGLEACGGAHYWARALQQIGHTVKLMAPQYVKPYVKTNKNDQADAEAICEAVGRPTMRFVPVKSCDQQGLLSLHRVRQGFVKARTAQANQIRGLLSEFGIVMPQGIHVISQRIPDILEDADNGLPLPLRNLLLRLTDHLKELNRQVSELEDDIKRWHNTNEASQRLATIPGVGPLTASAIVASVGSATEFKNARQLSAWLGLVPRQNSSGGKSKLLGISKRGDRYLRTLLIHGARSVINASKRNLDDQSWLGRLLNRCPANVATVALANKNARIIWALLRRQEVYQLGHRPHFADAA